MRYKALTAFLIFVSHTAFSQDPNSKPKRPSRKGVVFAYFGWNRAAFTKSDIHFKGDSYDFTLHHVVAKDRPTPLDPSVYLNPKTMSVPQCNYRVGYFFNNHYSVSFGFDHMKYVMVKDQVVKISGNIAESNTKYDGQYDNTEIPLSSDFLRFEHTNGLNYINLELRRMDEIVDLNHFKINVTEGLGSGILYPKTDAALLNFTENDQWHTAGYGISGMVGLQFAIYKYFFIQTEYKAGYINMPNILTTHYSADKADQHFFFSQFTLVLGLQVGTRRN